MGNGENAPERLLRQTDRLQTLNEIGRAVSATLDLGTLYETIYAQIGRVMDATQFFIAVHRPERNTINVPYLREEGALYLDQQVPFGNNVTTLVIERGAPLLFNTDEEYQRYVERNGLPGLTVGSAISEAKIFVPLSTGSRTIGALTVQSTRRYAYTLDDVQTLSVIASQAAVAIVNAGLYAQSQDNVLEMQALLDVAQTISGSLQLHTVLDSILVGMRRVIPYYYAAILLPDEVSPSHLNIVRAVGPAGVEPVADESHLKVLIPIGEGVTGTVFQSGESLIVPNLREFPRYMFEGAHEVRSEMAVPLKRGDAVVGVLDVEREEVDAFSTDDLNLLTLFGSQAAIAIENARLFGEQQRRVFELQTIQNIVQQLTPLHDLRSIGGVINRELKALIEFHSCRIFLLDPETQALVDITGSSQSAELRVYVGEGITGSIAARGEAEIIPNTLADLRAAQIHGTPRREESMIGAPLVYEGKVQGVITLSKLGINQFDENDLRLLEIIAGQAAIAFDRARLYEELRAEAVTDPLTGLYNRRYLMERFREEKSRAIRNRHMLAAIMMDIDKFKRVNDTYGHDAGDVVLRELARVTRSVVRAEDIVSRYGGEEFCVLLPETSLSDARHVVERLRAAIEAHQMPEEAGVQGITVSAGMALLDASDPGEELFSRADLAMYEVKHRGGNQVCVFDGGTFHFSDQDALSV